MLQDIMCCCMAIFNESTQYFPWCTIWHEEYFSEIKRMIRVNINVINVNYIENSVGTEIRIYLYSIIGVINRVTVFVYSLKT